MSNTQLIDQLLSLKKQKLSKQNYAIRLGVSISKIDELFKEIKQLKNGKSGNVEGITSNQNRENGTASAEFSHPSKTLSDEEIYQECNLSSERWKITQIWKSKTDTGFKYSANFKLREGIEPEELLEHFKDYLKSFNSPYKPIPLPKLAIKENVALLIPKQDFHFDKLDTVDNDLTSRKNQDKIATLSHISKATSCYNVDKVFYVLGSDYFNSEFTRATTKGTPQQNVGEYHEIFQQACDHEGQILTTMLTKVSNIEVIFIPGNHDYYKCWHLITWLKAYFKAECRIKFNVDKALRKYISYGTTAVMLHHGNEIKPQVLANIFPAEFKNQWSKHDNFFIVTGDKHKEIINDFGNVRHYGVKALSSSKSFWDEQNGYISGGESTSFIISSSNGITDIYKI